MGNTKHNTDNNTHVNWDNTDCVRITVPAHDAFLEEAAQAGRPQTLAEVVSEVVGGRMATRLSRNQRAARAWFAVNGLLEQRHTCGVYLRKPRMRDVGPVLVVYVDTPSRVTDFRANKELYLARLANGGVGVSDVDFRLSREGHAPGGRPGIDAARGSAARAVTSLVPLAEGERRLVEEMCATLPDGLRESAARAMSASLRREKTQKTQSDT